ncbi:MAG: TlpA family protein disulfide reductase [Pirellulaceae bacterium]|nr:TlpA family protein disulfide reductase [Pirellulaceae bacterium]
MRRRVELPLKWWRRESATGKIVYRGYQASVYIVLAVGFLGPVKASQWVAMENDTIEFMQRRTQDLGLLTWKDAPFDPSIYRGKTVILHVWADWCGPCLMTMPAWNQLNQRINRHDDVVLVGVSASRSKASHLEMCQKLGVTWPQVMLDRDTDRSKRIPVTSIPVNWILGPDGRVIQGNLTHYKAIRYINNLLADAE